MNRETAGFVNSAVSSMRIGQLPTFYRVNINPFIG